MIAFQWAMQYLKPKRMPNHDTSTLTTDSLAIKLSSLININSGNYDFTLLLIEELVESYSEHPVLIEALAYAIARHEDESVLRCGEQYDDSPH